MDWWQTLVVALCTYGFTKSIDHLISISNEKREFKRLRRDRMLDEIEKLKDEIGRYYELAANWKSHEMKAEAYAKMMAEDDQLIGKYNKYPDIVNAARDAIHWCKMVAYDERENGDELLKNKKELAEKYREFVRVCDSQLDKAV